MRILFDDTIDREVFSRSEVVRMSVDEMRLVERIRNAAFVVPVVVVTVTDQQETRSGHVDLELLPVDRAVHGTVAPYFQPGEPIMVDLDPASAGYALILASRDELVGKRLNLCWNRFSEGATPVVHWHAFSDTPKTKLAIAKAAAIVNFD